MPLRVEFEAWLTLRKRHAHGLRVWVALLPSVEVTWNRERPFDPAVLPALRGGLRFHWLIYRFEAILWWTPKASRIPQASAPSKPRVGLRTAPAKE